MKGTWTGYYRYDNEMMRNVNGFERTGFTINITSFDGRNFEGTVNDDVATGGMPDTGRVVGAIQGNKVHFRKFMPKGSEIHPNGQRVFTGKKHRTIYYSGVFSDDNSTITGTWKFRRRFIFILGLIPVFLHPGTGTWGMTLNR